MCSLSSVFRNHFHCIQDMDDDRLDVCYLHGLWQRQQI